MTPLQIQILFHYRCHMNDFREGDFSAPAVREAIDVFLRDNMLENAIQYFMTPQNRCYCLSARGKAFVDYVCSLPLPVEEWKMS